MPGLRPAKPQAFLAAIRTWINSHKDQVIIVLSLAVGIWLIGKRAYLIFT
jgi:hypothetical protein